MLTKEQKDIWLTALRSGQYIQGTGVLCEEEKMTGEHHFCCLGVLQNELEGFDILPYEGRHHQENDDLFHIEHAVAKLCQAPHNACHVSTDWIDMDTQANLTRMNDEEQRDFNSIAQWIEENIKPED